MNGKNDQTKTTLESLRKLRTSFDNKEMQSEALSKEFSALEDMILKLEEGTIEIAVFGEVSSGKSSLLNALLGEKVFETGARNGVTVIKGKREWNLDRHEFKGQANTRLVLTDTPGINEVDGEEREEIARETIRDADLVLFVIKSDLNDVEYRAIKDLHLLNKPLLVAFNKVDIYRLEERDAIIDSVLCKLDGIVKRENFLLTAGDPAEREVIIINTEGEESSQIRKSKPIIDDLKCRIFDVLADEGKAITALNASIFAADISDRIAQRKIDVRREFAEKIIRKYILIKAIAVGVNPIPLADMVGGITVDYLMLKAVGEVYDIELTFKGSQDLIIEIGKAMGLIYSVELISNLTCAVLEISTIGLANLVTGVPQGAVAGWTSYLIGSASHEYFANGASWGDKGPKSIIQKILDETDKESIMAEVKDGIREAISNRKNKKAGNGGASCPNN